MRYLDLSKEELINHFVQKLLYTNRGFNYYVDWRNAEAYREFDIELHAMNVLIKSNDFDNTFRRLTNKMPSVVSTFPLLFALAKVERDNVWKGKDKLVVVNSSIGADDDLEFSFNVKAIRKGLSEKQIEEYLLLFEQMGLKHLFLNLAESSIVDYVIGVLVGLDSNGRKNRGGIAFELACQPIVDKICNKYDIEILTQTTFKKLRAKEYGFNISEDMESRKADFILVKGSKALNIEVNYFNGNGSKPEEIIDSYINREHDLSLDGISFAFITDGKHCWGNDKKSQLLKAFRNLKYFMNFNLAKEGMLEEVILEVFNLKYKES